LGIEAGSNVYAYVENAPTVAVDPAGLQGCSKRAGKHLEDAGGGHGDEVWALSCQVLWASGSWACAYEPGYPPECEAKNRKEREERRKELERRRKVKEEKRKEKERKRKERKSKSKKPRFIFYCFVGGSTVWTESGPMPIEDVRPGAALLGRREGSDKTTFGKVSSVSTALARQLVALHLRNEIIQCTREHPFWVEGRGWVQAGDLKARDVLVDDEARHLPLVQVDDVIADPPVAVYNVTVDGTRTYFVGESRIWTHNKPR
jgi:hypothetical protein